MFYIKKASLFDSTIWVLGNLKWVSEILGKFETNHSVLDIWYTLKSWNCNLTRKKLNIFFLSFATMYLWETAFSAHMSSKAKYISHLNVQQDIRSQMFKIQPDCLIVQIKHSHFHRIPFFPETKLKHVKMSLNICLCVKQIVHL